MIPLAELLATAMQRSASDVLVMTGDSPAMRVVGQWIRFDHPKLTADEMDACAREILRSEAYQELKTKRELDFSCSFPKTGRVRCNIHYQRDHLAMVLRLLWPSLPNPEKLGIPANVIGSGDFANGLILLTGATGSGKSTTLAAIVEHINQHRHAHVITLEDPIEFMYTNARSIIEQREIGSDTATWHTALRTMLRQAPDVIVLGELRDLESISIALTAAETGHLVLATAHSSSAVGAISRMVDAFPPSQVGQVRLQLSQTLRLVFAQRLVPGVKPESRVLLYETMVNTPAVSNLIRTGELEQISNMINAGREHGMISFQQCHRELVARGLVPAESNPMALRPGLSKTA